LIEGSWGYLRDFTGSGGTATAKGERTRKPLQVGNLKGPGTPIARWNATAAAPGGVKRDEPGPAVTTETRDVAGRSDLVQAVRGKADTVEAAGKLGLTGRIVKVRVRTGEIKGASTSRTRSGTKR
jgi:hypothetical protein